MDCLFVTDISDFIGSFQIAAH